MEHCGALHNITSGVRGKRKSESELVDLKLYSTMQPLVDPTEPVELSLFSGQRSARISLSISRQIFLLTTHPLVRSHNFQALLRLDPLQISLIVRLNHTRHQRFPRRKQQTGCTITDEGNNKSVVPVELDQIRRSPDFDIGVDVVCQTGETRRNGRDEGDQSPPVDAEDISISAVWLIQSRQVEVLFLDDEEVGDLNSLYQSSCQSSILSYSNRVISPS